MNPSVMFMDCPAYMDRRGTIRCGLPAAVEYRYTVSTMAGCWKAPRSAAPAATGSTAR
jgi:hypothetical protein